jgi:hypothetical protein
MIISHSIECNIFNALSNLFYFHNTDETQDFKSYNPKIFQMFI